MITSRHWALVEYLENIDTMGVTRVGSRNLAVQMVMERALRGKHRPFAIVYTDMCAYSRGVKDGARKVAVVGVEMVGR